MKNSGLSEKISKNVMKIGNTTNLTTDNSDDVI